MSEKSFIDKSFIQVVMPSMGWGKVVERPEKNKLVVKLDINIVSPIQLPLTISDFSGPEISQFKVTAVEVLEATTHGSMLLFTIE